MESDLQTDDSRRDNVISKYMDAHASLPVVCLHMACTGFVKSSFKILSNKVK